MSELPIQLKQLKSFTLALVMVVMSSTVLADVRVLLDISTSLAVNDPQNNRVNAIVDLTSVIPNGEPVGIWTFGQYVNLLMPHERINNQWRSQARQKLNQLTSPAIRSNIGRVLDEAAYDFNFSNYRRNAQIVLVTDGKVNISPNTEVNLVERERVLTQLIPRYIAANAKIHTIAISNDADHAMLKQLSSNTGGVYQNVARTGSVSKAMMAIKNRIAPSTVMVDSSPSFQVSDSTMQVTVLLKHEKGAVSLMDPGGAAYSAVDPKGTRWKIGKGYSEVTLSSPAAGKWQIKGDINKKAPIVVEPDITINWVMPENDSIVRENVIRLKATLQNSDGSEIDSELMAMVEPQMTVDNRIVVVNLEGNTISARILPTQDTKQVNISLKVKGGTFQAESSRVLNIMPLITSELLTLEDRYEWRLYPADMGMQNVQINATANVMLESDNQQQMFMKMVGGYWSWSLPFNSPAGDYSVQLAGTVMIDGKSHDIPLEERMISLPMIGAMKGMDQFDTVLTMDLSEDFIKDPMPEFAELQADLIVDQNADEWSDAQD